MGEQLSNKKQVPIENGLFAWPEPEGGTYLLGSECQVCGKKSFPRRSACGVCFSEAMRDIELSTRGVVYACTVFRYKLIPPGSENINVPYLYGYVMLPEGVGVPTLFTDCDVSKPLMIETEVELVVRKFKEDAAGNEVVTYMFSPVERGGDNA